MKRLFVVLVLAGAGFFGLTALLAPAASAPAARPARRRPPPPWPSRR